MKSAIETLEWQISISKVTKTKMKNESGKDWCQNKIDEHQKAIQILKSYNS